MFFFLSHSHFHNQLSTGKVITWVRHVPFTHILYSRSFSCSVPEEHFESIILEVQQYMHTHTTKPTDTHTLGHTVSITVTQFVRLNVVPRDQTGYTPQSFAKHQEQCALCPGKILSSDFAQVALCLPPPSKKTGSTPPHHSRCASHECYTSLKDLFMTASVLDNVTKIPVLCKNCNK